MASFDRSYDFPLVYHCKLFGQSVLTDLKTNLKILTIFFFIKNCCNLLVYTAYCHVVMSCLHVVMFVYYLLVDC